MHSPSTQSANTMPNSTLGDSWLLICTLKRQRCEKFILGKLAMIDLLDFKKHEIYRHVTARPA